MKFELKKNINPRILEDLDFCFYDDEGWVYEGDTSTKLDLNNTDLEMPLIMYYLIKLDLIEII